MNRLNDLHAITVPTLIISGEHDYIPVDCAIAMKIAISHATLSVLRGCSHSPYYEDPLQYHAVLSAFLSKHIDS